MAGLAVAVVGAANAAPAKAPVVKKNVVRYQVVQSQSDHPCPFSHDTAVNPAAGV